MQKTTAFILALLWSIASVPAVAAPLFTLDIDVTTPGGITTMSETFSFDNFEELIDDLDEDELRMTFPNYDVDRDTVNARLDFRGLEATIDFGPAAGLIVDIENDELRNELRMRLSDDELRDALRRRFPDINEEELEDELRRRFPDIFADGDTVNARLDFRGLEATINFGPAAEDGEEVEKILVFTVRAGGEEIHSEAFTEGTTTDELIDALEAFLKSGGGENLNRIQAASIAHSPVDPIAGNPGSLANNQLSGQFREGFSDQVSQIAPERSSKSAAPESLESTAPENHILLGARFGRYSAGDRHSNVFTLPLGYSFRLKEGGRGLRKVAIELPITYAEIEGAESYAVSIGGSMTFGMNERWSLSPAVGVGVTGSVDLASGGGIGSVSLTSAYTVPFERFDLSIGNMVGYYETLKIEVGDYHFDPGVSNMVFRNGLMLSIPGTMGGREVVTEVWATDTRFTGDALYSEYQDEFGVAIGLAKSDGLTILSHLRAGVSYMTGDNVSGWALRLGYSF